MRVVASGCEKVKQGGFSVDVSISEIFRYHQGDLLDAEFPSEQ